MPQLLLRDSYDLQDLLAQAKVPTLLGTEATLGGISDGKLRVGQVPCGRASVRPWGGSCGERAWPGGVSRWGGARSPGASRAGGASPGWH